MKKCILWDFDNTLAFRRDGMWRAALVEALDDRLPGHRVSADAFRPALRSRFPWHDWESLHTDWSAEIWWDHVETILADAYRGVGLEEGLARELSRAAHLRYVDPGSFELFPDTVPVLNELREKGWSHIILSNHVPELPAIAEHLGLSSLVDQVLSSANTGVEKPHPQAYALARKAAGIPEVLWMVGDNPVADVKGAEDCGIPAILVRNSSEIPVERTAPDLWDVRRYLEQSIKDL